MLSLLIPLASGVILNILKTWEESGYCYVPSEEPAKSLSVPGLLSGDPASSCLLLLASGQPSPARGLTGHTCSVAPAGFKGPAEEGRGTGGAVCLRVGEHASIPTRRQPQLLVQAPTSFSWLNCHFPATLKGPLAPAHPPGARLSLLRHASTFSHHFGGKNSA